MVKEGKKTYLNKKELVEWAAFGYRKVPNTVQAKKVGRKVEKVCEVVPAIPVDKKLFAKYKALTYQKGANFFDIFFLIVGILAAAFGALLQFDVLDSLGVSSNLVADMLPEAVADFANWIIVGVGAVIALICAITTGKHGKKNARKAKYDRVKLIGILKEAEKKKYDYLELNKWALNPRERKLFDMEDMVTRAINKTKTVEDEFDF